MVFSSINFLFIFLPLTLLSYYLCRNIKWKNIILLASSLIFYAWGEPVYIILMLISILFNYYIGKDIDEGRHRKYTLIFGIIVNLLILGYFKYAGLIVDSVNKITGLSLVNRELPLPIGISFYTFQAMSYIIDVYRGGSKAQQKLLPFAVYITMFPQLIAGPIVRYEDIENQLNERRFSGRDFGDGVVIFVKGLAKKVILANCIGALHAEIFGIADRGALAAWIGALAYTLQIFNDFSGYSDMAIGLGKMLGFDFSENFDRPYASTSITQFWRRWHISLGTWFREYLYIPLGGNRRGAARQIINLLIVWTLTGLWHGAAWNFVAWGFYYGVLLILEKFVFAKVQKKLPKIANWIITFLLVVIGWVFFFCNSLGEAFSYLGTMFGAGGAGTAGMGGFYILAYALLLVLGFLPSAFKAEGKIKLPVSVKWFACVLLFMLSVAFLVSESYNPFLYFRF